MLGKKKPPRESAEARSVVVDVVYRSAGEIWAGADGDSHLANRYDVKVRVRFDDGSTVEISAKLKRDEVGQLTEGDVVPVRYDPADRSKIEIDAPAIKAHRDAARARLKELAIARGERELRGEPTGVQTTRRIGDLMRELAAARAAGDEDAVLRIQDEIARGGRPESPT